MFKKRDYKKGFTLIELLAVMAIIAILAGIVILSLNNARAKSRDSKRKADLDSIRTALEMYYDDFHKYPSETTKDSDCWLIIQQPGPVVCGGSIVDFSEIIKGYLSPLPTDPINGIMNDNNYIYQLSMPSKNKFCLVVKMEIDKNANLGDSPFYGFSGGDASLTIVGSDPICQ